MASTLSVLVLLTAVTAGGHRPGSGQFQVGVRVVAPMRASAPATVTLGAALAAAEPSGDRWVVRLAPSASVRGGATGVLIGLPGQSKRPCGSELACEVAVRPPAEADAASPVVALVFLPDGAPTAIVER